MRVPTISKYSTATYQLGVLTTNLKDANDVMSTQKKMNTLSDDPIGMTQVLDLKESLKHLEQIETNVEMGRTWLTGVESSLKSVNDIILNVKNDVLRYSNASLSADNRKDAIDNINNVIEQIVSLGNTRMNGSYIFSGSSTNVKPIEYYPDENPPRVAYVGESNSFKIRSDKNAEIAVGRVGSDVFWENSVAIDSTNNSITFREDPGQGQDYIRTVTATIPSGDYDNKTLTTTIRNELNKASAKNGHGVTYDVKYNDDTKQFSIVEDGSYKGYMATEFLWGVSGNAETDPSSGEKFIKQDAYIDSVAAGGTALLDDINTRIYDAKAINISDTPETFKLTRLYGSFAPPDDSFTFTGEYWGIENSKGVALPSNITESGIPPDTLVEVTYDSNGGGLPSKVVGNANGVDIYFDNDFDKDGNPISDISISFDKSMSKDDYVKFTINPAKEIALDDTSLGHEIGFVGSNMISAPPTSNEPVLNSDLPLTIDSSNNKIDFQEVIGFGDNRAVRTLTASVKEKDYESYDELAKEIEKAMDAISLENGNGIKYSVTSEEWGEDSQRFTIKENGTNLDGFNLLWESGDNAPLNNNQSIGSLIGFTKTEDNISSPVKSNEPVERGIFNTLIDLADYLKNNDVDGIERTIGRLENSYNHMTSMVADTGMKYSRLETRKIITSEMNLNLNERRSSIEDADIVEAIMNLTSIQSAYEAALGSTSKIMKTSLMDYL
ncbi:MAG: flagellar hook-associated protein FlgL [Desulfamplus sp.]|nr:flagellar hook-associated protein FlgL [Desulfamplus sp.]